MVSDIEKIRKLEESYLRKIKILASRKFGLGAINGAWANFNEADLELLSHQLEIDFAVLTKLYQKANIE